MAEVSKSVTDHLIKLQELTQTNLDLLNALNSSLHTKQEYISVNYGDNVIAIPSFLSLENKINNLQENFENLINAPLTGEAYFNVDGNSRAIEVKSYTTTPNKVNIDNKENLISTFKVEKNNRFKDFLNPIPYINLDLSYKMEDGITPVISNDITTILVKKIIPIHRELKKLFEIELTRYEDVYKDGVIVTEEVIDENGNTVTQNVQKEIGLSSVSYDYPEMLKKINSYIKDVDYIEYDSKYEFPTRKNIGYATYVIKDIVEDVINDMENYITLQFRNDLTGDYSNNLTYKLFDETIERSLNIGDQLITQEGNAKFEIIHLDTNTNTVKLKVLNGEYVNLFKCVDPSYISNLSKIKFYKSTNFDNDRIIKIPLEEDKYVFITTAAVNSRMNVQSPWGRGTMINTYMLLADDSTINKETSFGTYYNNYVTNIGDILTEMSSIMSNHLSKYSKEEFKTFTTAKPVLNTDSLKVVQINKHLDNSQVIKDIRAKYSEKQKLNRDLVNIQESINKTNNKLSQTSFDDTTGMREIYLNNLNNKLSERATIKSQIDALTSEISELANTTAVPIENAKYRIRGFFDYKKFLDDNGLNYLSNSIRGIRVQYRYKNVESEQGGAMDNFIQQYLYDQKTKEWKEVTPIFSDWNNMIGFDNNKTPYYNNGYKYNLMEDNFDSNEPSWNQIEIPITQGETVDVRVRVIYDMGYPFVETSSAWSEILNVKFPIEFTTNVEILDIIKENNNDIETNKINNAIKVAGITEHIDDKSVDQNITYFHTPEHIASGFYTEERRIIPLKDKLSEMNNDIIKLIDVINGSNSQNITVTIENGTDIYNLIPYQTTNISTIAYNNFDEIKVDDADIFNGNYVFNSAEGVVTVAFLLNIKNTSNHIVNIYPIIPGPKDKTINLVQHVKSGIYLEDYCFKYKENKTDEHYLYKDGVGYRYPATEEDSKGMSFQTGNQLVLFRIKDVFNGKPYYKYAKDPEFAIIENGDLKGYKPIATTQYNNMQGAYTYEESKSNIGDKNFSIIYINLKDQFGMHLPEDNSQGCKVLNPGELIQIPLVFEYRIRSSKGSKNYGAELIEKTMSFDIRTSLFTDPFTYTFKIIAKNEGTSADKAIQSEIATWVDRNNNTTLSTTWSGSVVPAVSVDLSTITNQSANIQQQYKQYNATKSTGSTPLKTNVSYKPVISTD